MRIERAIRQNAGLLAGQILEGGSETVTAETVTAEAGESEGAQAAEGDGTVTPLAGGAARRGRRG
jgi:hypothetical protein